MHVDLTVLLRRWFEPFAHREANWHLNHQLARRLGDPKGTKYEWGLHGNDDIPHTASWCAFMCGEDPCALIAYTTVAFGGRQVTVGAWIDYDVIVSEWEPCPTLVVITEVLPRLPMFGSDWDRNPAVFEHANTFARLAEQC